MCFGMKENESLYSSGGGNINGIPFNESKEQAKFGFSVTAITTYRGNFEKSYLTQF